MTPGKNSDTATSGEQASVKQGATISHHSSIVPPFSSNSVDKRTILSTVPIFDIFDFKPVIVPSSYRDSNYKICHVFQIMLPSGSLWHQDQEDVEILVVQEGTKLQVKIEWHPVFSNPNILYDSVLNPNRDGRTKNKIDTTKPVLNETFEIDEMTYDERRDLMKKRDCMDDAIRPLHKTKKDPIFSKYLYNLDHKCLAEPKDIEYFNVKGGSLKMVVVELVEDKINNYVKKDKKKIRTL